MKKTKMLFAAFVLLVLSCNTLNNPPFGVPTPTSPANDFTTNCTETGPSQSEIDSARRYDADYFKSPDWKTSYTVMESQIGVARISNQLNAVANFDYVIFCGVTSEGLDRYYSNDTFAVIFQNYDGHDAQKNCRSGDLRLYEFKVKDQGYDYNARFWVEIVDPNHIRQSLLVFPVADITNMDSYSRKIMPKLISCK